MKKILILLTIAVAMICVPMVASAQETIPTGLTLIGGDNYNNYCCPFPIIAQGQGVATDVAILCDPLSVNTTLAAGQGQLMMGARRALQFQAQTAAYSNGQANIDVKQVQFQLVGRPGLSIRVICDKPDIPNGPVEVY